METLHTGIASREDTGPFKKPLLQKEHCNDDDNSETNYVDLGNKPSDMKSDSAKTVKVTFTGEGNQLAIFKCKGDASVSSRSPGGQGENDKHDSVSTSLSEECLHNVEIEKCYAERLCGERDPLIRVPSDDEFTGDESKKDAESEPKSETPKYETEELQYTDMYLNSRCESKDGTGSADVEPHYITTHEIQLTELDHDVDYEFGRGSCWDFEDDNLVYSFVDYASFESGEKTRGRIQSKAKSGKVPSTLRAAKLGSTESELCESDKCASSDEGVGKTEHEQEHRNTTGPIHLSIKTSSRAINEHGNVLQQKNLRLHNRRAAEERQYSFRSSDSKSEALYDRYFIPPPGRQHLASKLRVKDINEYSSGASSSVSELDDADKEVRNLTARSFRSLACPYFDAINLSSSSESSMSEHSLSINKWSAFMDLNYSNLTQGLDQNMLVRKTPTPVLEGNNDADYKNNKDALRSNIPNSQTNILSLKNNFNSQQSSGASKKIEIRSKPDSSETITLTETLNFSCNVGGGMPARERRAKRSLNASGSRSTAEIIGITPTKCEAENQVPETVETFEDTHKKAIFASSLLKNVISKKMLFEQERKMERGEICDTHPISPLCPQSRDQDAKKENELQSDNSETESGHSQEELKDVADNVSCVSDDEPPETPRSQTADLTESSCAPGIASKIDPRDAQQSPVTPSQTSAFKTWKDGEQESAAQGDVESQCALEETPPDASIRPVMESNKCVEGESSKMIKMSHLYVPSSQLMPKEKEAVGLSLHNLKVNRDVAESEGGGCAKHSSGQLPCAADPDKTSQCQKAPEIKIRIQSVKENQGNQFNIANLLTPNIHYNVNHKKGESKSNLLTLSDRVPHFMVRDIRDNKCKFQTPIHQVRDVRKLVKSSYRFVALENTCGASGTASSATPDGKPVTKRPFPTSMVIKCQSVNTNSATKDPDPINVSSKREEVNSVHETARTSQNLPSECTTKSDGVRATTRAPCAKQHLTEQHEFSLKIDAKKSDGNEKKPESKVRNQIALEKLKAAVKTMEQLYVFDRNEWKRKTQAPRAITDSHVLPLITKEKQGVTTRRDIDNECGRADNEKFTSTQLHTDKLATAPSTGAVMDEDKMYMPTSSHIQEDTAKLVTQRADSLNNKCVFSLGGNLKAPTHTTRGNESTQQICSSKSYTYKSHKAPLSLTICPPKAKSEERGNDTVSEHQQHQPSDSDNYLTIPVKAADSKQTQPLPKPSHQPLQRSPIVTESWSPESQAAMIYHHAVPLPAVPTIPAPQPQVLCLTPPAEPLQPHVQRKLLLDPTTGQYYLVEAPVPMQPAAQRFYDPESGQYLDIPLSLTPVPVSVSPVTLSPAATHPPTYLVYPSTLLPPHPQHSTHSSTCSEGEDAVETGSMCLIQPGMAGPGGTKPVISISSQQSARIVAPPSFDGTTMSFVVEHR